MKLTRARELVLINYALDRLLENITINVPGFDKPKRKLRKHTKSAWTPERREKFQSTMKAKWANKKAAMKK